MPNKSAKYGLKIFWVCDSCIPYPIDGLVYRGRDQGEGVHTHNYKKQEHISIKNHSNIVVLESPHIKFKSKQDTEKESKTTLLISHTEK